MVMSMVSHSNGSRLCKLCRRRMASNEDSLGGSMPSRPSMHSRGVVEDGVIKCQA